MENLQGLFDDVPPISRIWTVCMIAINSAVALKIVPPYKLVFIPEQAFYAQPWRLITSFCYLGDLSISTALAIWNTIVWIRSLEEKFIIDSGWLPDITRQFDGAMAARLAQKHETLKSVDFVWFLMLICGSIISLSTFGAYVFGHRLSTLGFVLYEVLSYIVCRITPEVQLSIFGLINITGVYIPFFAPVLDWVSQPTFKRQYTELLTGQFGVLKEIFTSQLAWKSFCGLALGHTWWFISQVATAKLYRDNNEEREKYRTRTVRRVEQKKMAVVDIMKSALRAIVLPPWYWIIVYNMRRQQVRDNAQERGNVQERDQLHDQDVHGFGQRLGGDE